MAKHRRYGLATGITALMLNILPVFAKKNTGNGRLTQLFNFDWKCQAGNPENVYTLNYDDSGWRNLGYFQN